MKFQDLPIKRKLTLALMTTAGVTLLLACGAFVVVEVALVRRELVSDLTTRAEILAANSAGALAFANQADAREVLGALRVDRRATTAALYDKDGRVFAAYPAAMAPALLPDRPERDGHRFTETHLLVFHPVMQGARRLGSIYIQADLSELRERLALYGGIVFSVVVVAAGVAFLLASKLQAKISQPLLSLADAARVVAERKDYSIRAPALGADELGQLTTAFNEMLARIHERDTALRASEASLKDSLRETGDLRAALDEHAIVAVTDPRGKITFVNDKFCAISKYARDELLGQDHRIINSGHHPKEFIRGLWTTIASGRVWHGEIKNRAKDGTFYWVDTTIVPFLNPDGKPRQYVAIRADITERKRVEEEIHQLNAVLEQRVRERTAQFEEASRMKSEFLANMSHELRTPLNGIIGFSEFLVDGKPGPLLPKQKEYLGCVLDSGRHLLQLINDVLDLSKVEAGKMELNPETFRLAKAVEDACAVARAIAQKKRVQLHAEVAPELVEVTLDQQKFKQVLYNLLSNAVKFTNDGGRVDISLRPLAGDRFQLQVRDSGIGIRAEDFPKLFREFTQLDSGAARRYGGTGLGLSLTRKIVEFQQGTITVASELGVGSTFTVELPRSLPKPP